MSQNIENIIATDKQAREIVQKARSRREQIMAEAAAESEKIIREGEEKLAGLKSSLNADNESFRISLEEKALKEFSKMKAALDKVYSDNEDAWARDIFERLTQA